MTSAENGSERRRANLTEVVYASLCRSILRGEYQPGQSLPSEGELAASHNVSKAVIRAVMQQLSALGVVELRQGKAGVVKRLTPRPLEVFFSFAMMETESGLLDALQLRRSLETSIAQLAADSIRMADLRKLREALAAMEAARRDRDAFIQADLHFHLTLAECAGNRLLMFLVQALRGTILETVRVLHDRKVVSSHAETLERHAAIVEAIAKGDPEAARLAMSLHFDASEARTREAGGKDVFQPERIIPLLEEELPGPAPQN